MVSMRHLSLLFVFILALLVQSSAHRQVMETILAADGIHDLQRERKNLAKFKEGFDAAPSAAEARKRKQKWGLDEKRVTVVEGTKISEYESTGKNSRKWLTGFTAFAADYHVPKSHPPKHN